jgi:hypothetical protein
MIGFSLGWQSGCPDRDMQRFHVSLQTNSGIVFFICAATTYDQMLYIPSFIILPTMNAVLSYLLTASQKQPQNFQSVCIEQTREYLTDCDEIWYVSLHCCTVHVVSISSLLFQLMHFSTL